MKNSLLRKTFILCIMLLIIFTDCTNDKNDFEKYSVRAFSLKNVCKNLTNVKMLPTIQSFGGINRFIGFVLDKEAKDIILVGIKNENASSANFDDFIVALRSRILYDEYPLVSIDPPGNGNKTRLQKVRFDGHLENTEFGQKFLNCDIFLKKYSLQKIEPIPEVLAYNKLLEEDIISGFEKDGSIVKNISWILDQDFTHEINSLKNSSQLRNFEFQARFWYYPIEPIKYIWRPNVFLISDLNLGLKAEEVFSNSVTKINAREKFAESWTTNFQKMFEKYPDLRNLKSLYDFTAIAIALCDSAEIIKQYDYIDYFLNTYSVKFVATPDTYNLEEIFGKVEMNNGLIGLVSISGGIKFGEEIKLLNYGNYDQLKKIVLNSRPNSECLIWGLPVEGWKIPNTHDLFSTENISDNTEQIGSTFFLQATVIDPKEQLTKNDNTSFNGFTEFQHDARPLKGVSMKMEIDTAHITKVDSLKEVGNGIRNLYKTNSK